jgi:hypothetical protein
VPINIVATVIRVCAERMRHRLRDGPEAQLDSYSCLVGDQPGDVFGDRALDRPRRP